MDFKLPRILLLIASLAMLSIGASNCDPADTHNTTPTYEPCLSDSECNDGYICDMTECLSCCPDADPGEPCIAACCGQCVPEPEPEPSYIPCLSDSECNDGYICDMTECLSCCPDADPGEFCITVCCGQCLPSHDGDDYTPF